MSIQDQLDRALVDEAHITDPNLPCEVTQLTGDGRTVWIARFADGHVIRSRDPAVPCRIRSFRNPDPFTAALRARLRAGEPFLSAVIEVSDEQNRSES